MKSTAALVAGHGPASILTWIDGRPLTAASFCGLAESLAAAMPAASHVVNLCEDSPRFLILAAAAWLRGRTLLLPPDRLVRTLVSLASEFPGSVCVCDREGTAAVARDCGFVVFMPDTACAAQETWPPPEIPSEFVAACLHTSGSTGTPSRHCKTWDELCGGAEVLVEALGVPRANAGVLGTVAPQHMFGFETTIMFPLRGGASLLPVRPALPGDMRSAMRVLEILKVARAWLFTTPLQLQAFHSAGGVDFVERVVTATMPLDAVLARRIERDWNTRVDEIYGCTEGGTLAFRRPTETDVFAGGQGVEFAVDQSGRASAAGRHLPERVPLADRIELVDGSASATSRRMRLLGRDGDLVKVAGKRASLAGLTATLRSVPGVEDGVFFFPTEDAKRLCAVVVAPSGTLAGIQNYLAETIDPAFLPRPLLLVDSIPRSASLKASLPALRDLVASHTRPGSETAPIVTTERFEAGDPVFAGHFPGRPVVPGVLLLERVEAALGAQGLRVTEVTVVKFHVAAAPGEALSVRIGCDDAAQARFEISRGTTLIASGAVRTARTAAG